MTREVQDIPPAQRRVRWSVALSSRWPLGLIGLLMALYGGLIALMLFYARVRDDAMLDRGPVVRAEGTLEKVGERQTPAWLTGEPCERIWYRFTSADGTDREGESFAPAGRFAMGDPVSVEYLGDQPEINRAAGTRHSLLGDLVSPVMGLIVLPGVLLVLLWLQGAHDLRRMIAAGDVAAAEPVRVEKVRWVIPVMLRAHYRFRDRHARWCEGQHWVPARSPLGIRLTTDPHGLAAVHDRGRPERSRLVVSSDFAPRTGTRAQAQAAPRA